MFGLLVFGYVVEQGLLVGETLIAGVALVGLVSLMTPRVGLQVGQLGEGLGAAWNRKTRVRKGPGGSLIAQQRESFLPSQSVKFNWCGALLGTLERRKRVLLPLRN